MRLLLIRHGSAEMNQDDDLRPLTEAGRQEAAIIAGWIKKLPFEQPTIWHSEKVRAKEAAGIILETTGWESKLSEVPGLSPSSPVDVMATRIAAEDSDLVIVGHMPFMSSMASELVTRSSSHSYWNFETCAALYLERAGTDQWVVCGFTMPSQL